jgi:uncharacterized membrane protein YheB (UPF0754 family)
MKMSEQNSPELAVQTIDIRRRPYTVSKSRSHAVTFRLAEREYRDLVNIVAQQGARSLSDYTRAIVMNKVAEALTDKYVEDEICSLSSRLEAFDVALRDLRRHVHEILSRTGGKEI